MDLHFEMALRQIDMGKYESAARNLENAIDAEEGNGDTKSAMECRCVLGELLANMGETERAREEFNKVLGYCTVTNSLPDQYKIARDFINAFDGKLPDISGKPEKDIDKSVQ